MLKNYFRIAYRALLNSKAFSFINVFGLTVGTTAFLFIIHYVRFERSYEDFNANADNIYRITIDFYNGSEYEVTDCETHAPMGPLLKEKMPEVREYVRMFHNDGLQDIKVGTQKFLDEGIYFADTSAFRIFDLTVLHGESGSALANPKQAVLTASTARKYFGRMDVVGETIEIDKTLYQITSVIADLPANTHLKFTALLSHITLSNLYDWYKEDGWGGNNEYTYLLMSEGTNLYRFNEKLSVLSGSLKDKLNNAKYVAEPIKEIHLFSNKTFEPEVNGSARTVYFLLIIAVFIIVIAWVNYINLSTARAIERAREVGIRKVMGSLRSQLIFQFLSESVIVNLLAVLLAFVFFQSMLPLFRGLTGQPLPFNLVADPVLWYLLIALVTTGSILSGVYPALVLSSFDPATVLKGKFKSSLHGQFLRKGLVVFQFGTTMVLLICMLTVYLQIHHLRTFDLGMNIEQTLVIRAPRLDGPDSVYNSSFQNMKTKLLQNPEVKAIVRSNSLPGLSLHELSSTSFFRVGQEKKDESHTYYYFGMDADFIPAMGMRLVSGRNFDSEVPNHDRVIINEEAVNKLGFSNPEEAIGAKITFRTRWPGEPATIIGVIRNYYQRSPKEKHIPMLFQYLRGTDYFSIRLNSANISETLGSVKTVYNEVFPNTVLNYFFLDEKYDQQYQADARFGQVIATFSVLAIFIACLGLFGLSSYTIVQRTKEIGIRKVLGASVAQIVRLLSREFVRVIMMAALLALPVAYFAANEWLSYYEARINLNVWMFLWPIVVILLLALCTVSFQTIRTALTNPSNSLKQE